MGLRNAFSTSAWTFWRRPSSKIPGKTSVVGSALKKSMCFTVRKAISASEPVLWMFKAECKKASVFEPLLLPTLDLPHQRIPCMWRLPTMGFSTLFRDQGAESFKVKVQRVMGFALVLPFW